MKITSSILFLITIWLGQVHSANMDFRYKPRGPPRPPRQPPLPHYMKKWEQNRIPPRNTNRPPRPIPLEHMAPHFIQPQIPSLLGPPIIKPQIPIRTIWQNQIQLHQPLQLQQPTQLKIKQEKIPHFSPQINNVPEYDYQLQTNTIPTHSVPIKQVGEKGPIHTIPAPNLSPADRPAIIEEQKRPAYSFIQQSQQLSTAANTHSYQVTEPNDQVKNAQKNFRDQQLYFANSQSPNYKQQSFNNVPEGVTYANIPDQQTDLGLSQQEIYHLINSHLNQKTQEPQQLYNNYDLPIMPQALVQQPLNLQPHEISIADYNAMIGQAQAQAQSQIQALQPDSQYLKQQQNHVANQNLYSNHPNMQVYERNNQNDDQSFDFSGDNFSNLPRQNEPFIQEVFELGDDSVDTGNRVEAKSDIQDKISEGAVYYASLPNRQAAETLASLQTAGKNSNLKQFDDTINSKTPLEIYVPDSQQFSNFEVSSSIRHKKDGVNPVDFEINEEYVDNETEDNSDEQSDVQQQSQRMFGKRIKPK